MRLARWRRLLLLLGGRRRGPVIAAVLLAIAIPVLMGASTSHAAPRATASLGVGVSPNPVTRGGWAHFNWSANGDCWDNLHPDHSSDGNFSFDWQVWNPFWWTVQCTSGERQDVFVNVISDPVGWFDQIDFNGNATGWACDADNFGAALQVNFFVDGPAGSGTFAGSTIANIQREQGVADNCGGNPHHGFSFSIPAQFRTGNSRLLYAYGINIGAGDHKNLGNSPRSFTLWNPPTLHQAPQVAPAGFVHPGTLLTTSDGIWSPHGPYFSYQWLRDGQLIPGAESNTYTTTTADLGKHIKSRVTSCPPTPCNTADSSNQVRVEARPVGHFDAVDSNGIARGWACDGDNFGTALQVDFYVNGPLGSGTHLGAVTANVPREAGVAANCGNNANHGFTFSVPSQYRDGASHPLYAYATNLVGGNKLVISNSPRTFTLWNPPVLHQAPQVFPQGFVHPGTELSTTNGSWSPQGPEFSYQWYRDGQAISGAVFPTYVAATADLGKHITSRVWSCPPSPCGDAFSSNQVRVEARPVGHFDDVDHTGLATGWVCDADNFGTALQVDFYVNGPLGSGDHAGTVIADVERDGAVAANCGNNANHGFTFNVPANFRDGVSRPMYAYATNLVGGNKLVISNSPQTFLLHPPPLLVQAPQIVPEGAVFPEDVLSTNNGVWSPDPPEFSYQWLRDGDPIDGAILPTYEVQEEDVGFTIKSRVTACAPFPCNVSDSSNEVFVLDLIEDPPGPDEDQATGTDEDGCAVHGCSGSGVVGDPVNTRTGAFTTAVADLDLPGTGVSFAWRRAYTSADTNVGRLGPGWADSYSTSLTIETHGDVVLHGEDGQLLEYDSIGGGAFDGADGSRSTLTAVVDGYDLVRTDQVKYHFDSTGRLLSVKDRNGQGVNLGYAQGRLQTVTDAAQRQATISYNADNLVSRVETSDGRSVSYGYTGGRLTSVSDVRGKQWTYTYVGGRLESIVDPLGHVEVTNVYDSEGRVERQTDALGREATFDWNDEDESVTVTDPGGNEWTHDYEDGVLVSEVNPLGNETVVLRDSELNPTSVTSATNETTLTDYDAAGNLESIKAPNSLGGGERTMDYNDKNDVVSVEDALGTVTEFEYDGNGNLEQITQAEVPIEQHEYDGLGRVISTTDANGKTTRFTYDSFGNRTSETNPLGNKTTYTYDAAGRVLTRVDPKGNLPSANPADFTWSWTYNAAGQTLTETDPLGNVTTHTYDDAGNELAVTDAKGRTTTHTYDGANRLLTTTAPDGGVTTYTYDLVGNKATERNPRGNTTTFTYDAANRLASETTPTGAKTTYFYDADGNRTRVVGPRGNAPGANPDDFDSTSTYDAAGRALEEIDPLGNVTERTYDAHGNVLSVTDPNGKTTSSSYDTKNRLVTVIAPDGGVTRFTYDAVGNKLTETDPRGNVTTFAYDDANRLVSTTKPAGGKTTLVYDANGNLVEQVEPRGNVSGADPNLFKSTFAYDRANRQIRVMDPLGSETVTTYDAVGNTMSVRDALNRTTAYTYDSLDRLTTVTAPDLGVTTYTYDPAGNVLTRKDARDRVTSHEYDADDRLTRVTSPTAQVWTTAYDVAGNVSSTTDATGNATPAGGDGMTTFAYDHADRLTSIGYSDATPDVAFVYDAVGNRVQMTDGLGAAETRTYDSVNRVTSVVRGSDTFSYAYDLAGNVTRRTYPGNFVIDYTYDADNRLYTAVANGLSTVHGYDAAGNPVQKTLPSANGYVESRVYDRAGRLTELASRRGTSTLARFVATLDSVGNPTRVDRTGALSQTQTYTYDANDRLLSTCFQTSCSPTSSSLLRWTYDKVGNRLTEQRGSSTTSYTYNDADQLLSAGSSTTFAYDQNGNQTRKGSRTFTYDLADRMRTTTSGSTTTTYTYDGDGNRVRASTGTSSSSITNFVWDIGHGLPQLALERNGSGSLQRRYTYGLDRISMTAGSSTYYFHHDALGSVTNITSSTGSTRWTASYEPFGSIRTENSNSAPTNFLKFTGEYHDPTGLYHLRARQLDPTIGRFLGVDPAEPALTSPLESSYAYVGNRPTRLVDPTGETPEFPPSGVYAARMATTGCTPGVSAKQWHDFGRYELGRNLMGRLMAALKIGVGWSSSACPIIELDPSNGVVKISHRDEWAIEDIGIVTTAAAAGWEIGPSAFNRPASWVWKVPAGTARFYNEYGWRSNLPGADIRVNTRFFWDPYPKMQMSSETLRDLGKTEISYGSRIDTWWEPSPRFLAKVGATVVAWKAFPRLNALAKSGWTYFQRTAMHRYFNVNIARPKSIPRFPNGLRLPFPNTALSIA
jgi:RHS repeat-associated protein